jgi:hypothetical protein
MLTRLLTLATLVFTVACASSQRPAVVMSPEAQAAWDRCAANVERWCVDHSHGSLSEKRQCMHDESERFAGLPNEGARASYLGSHGCPQTPPSGS